MVAGVDLGGWELLTAILAVIIVIGLVLLVWLTREPAGRRTRVGFFVEHDHDKEDPE